MTRIIAFYTTFTPSLSGRFAKWNVKCPTSQSRFQFKYRKTKQKKKKKKKNVCQTHLFSIHLWENKPRWTKKKKYAGWCFTGGGFATFERSPLRKVHTRTHSPWYDTPWQNVENSPLPRTALRQQSTSIQQLTATTNAPLRLQHEFTSRSRLVSEEMHRRLLQTSPALSSARKSCSREKNTRRINGKTTPVLVT